MQYRPEDVGSPAVAARLAEIRRVVGRWRANEERAATAAPPTSSGRYPTTLDTPGRLTILAGNSITIDLDREEYAPGVAQRAG